MGGRRALADAGVAANSDGAYDTAYGVSFLPWHGNMWVYSYRLGGPVHSALADGKVDEADIAGILAALATTPDLLRVVPAAVEEVTRATGTEASRKTDLLGAWTVYNLLGERRFADCNPLGLRYFPLWAHGEMPVGSHSATTFHIRGQGTPEVSHASIQDTIRAFGAYASVSGSSPCTAVS